VTSLDKLLSIGSPSIGSTDLEDNVFAEIPEWCSPIRGLLKRRNGFYAFESALHVLPVGTPAHTIDCIRWNRPDLWKACYGADLTDVFMFAEDAFGRQFGLKPSGVIHFEPETGIAAGLASDLDEWAASLLADHRWLTGWPLAHEWQSQNGRLADGERLVPVIPFIAGGEYAVSNLHALRAEVGMQLRCEFYQQTKDLRPGDKVKIMIKESD